MANRYLTPGAILDSTNVWLADQTFNDNVALTFGTGGDVDVEYNGTNFLINPRVVGSGNVVFGSGEAGTTAATGVSLRAPDLVTGGAGNVVGADLTVIAGLGTGTGDVGQIIFQTPRVAASGDNIQTLTTLVIMDAQTMSMRDDQFFSWGTSFDIMTLLRTTSLAADEELGSVIEGTSDHQGVAANSFILSNTTDNGDVLFLVSDGGNSLEYLLADADVAHLYLGHGMINTTIRASGDITIASSAGSLNVTLNAADADAMTWNDGTTDYYNLDTRIDTSGVHAHLFDTTNPSFANIPTASFTLVNMVGYTFNVTTDADDITGSFSTQLHVQRTTLTSATVSTNYTGIVSSIRIRGPAAGNNVILDNMASIHIEDGGGSSGTETIQSGIHIDDLTVGTTDYGIFIAGADTAAIWVNSADPIHVGLAGTATGKMEWSGATSGTVTMTVAAAAGTWTFTLPVDDGNASDFLQTNGSGVTSWVANTAAVTALNNATDNELVTVGATTTELEAEAALTFNGTTAFTYSAGNSTSGSTFIVANSTNSGASNAIIDIQVGGTTSTGDPQLLLTVPSGTSWYIAVNNDSDDQLVLGTGTTVGSNRFWQMSPVSSGLASIFTHTFFPVNATLSDSASAEYRFMSIDSQTTTLAGTTTITTLSGFISIGTQTITGGGGAVTVNKATIIKGQAPIESTDVTLVDASFIRILNTSGTPTNQAGIYIEDLTAGATADYGIFIEGADTAAIWVNSADPIHLGVAGASTGKMEWAGATSGVVTMTVAAAAGTWTMVLPTGVAGTGGDQLTDAAGNGVTSWAAVASERQYKIIVGELTPKQALSRILGQPVVDLWHYDKAKGRGTGDWDNIYAGVMADQFPEVMDFGARRFAPASAFGYTVQAIKALEQEIKEIKELKELVGV